MTITNLQKFPQRQETPVEDMKHSCLYSEPRNYHHQCNLSCLHLYGYIRFALCFCFLGGVCFVCTDVKTVIML